MFVFGKRLSVFKTPEGLAAGRREPPTAGLCCGYRAERRPIRAQAPSTAMIDPTIR